MPPLQANFGAMNDGVTALQNCLKALQQHFTDLEGAVKQCETIWDDAGKQAFLGAKQKFDSSYQDLQQNALQPLLDNLSGSLDGYQQALQSITSAFQG